MAPLRVLVVALFAGCASSRYVSAAPADAWSAVPLGADRAAVLAAAGLDPTLTRTTTLLELLRRLHESDLRGEGVRARVLDVFDPAKAPSGDAAGAGDPASEVPLPLTPAVWDRCVAADTAGVPLAQRIVADARAGLMYLGLASLDDRTRTFIADACDTLLTTARERPGTFAAIARSLRVADGRVRVPGGAAAATAWEELVGIPLSEPSAFFKRLLLADEGRLGWCFDTLFQLDDGRQAYALAVRPRTALSAGSLQPLYREFMAMDPSWSIEARPFARVPVDAARVLAQIAVEEAGPAGQLPASWLRAVFEDADADAEPAAPIAAPELLRLVLVNKWDERQDRLWVLLYLQRMAADHPGLTSSQVVALGRMARSMPALAFCLEHIGIRSVETIMAVAARASALTGRDHPEPAAVTAFQSAIALLDRLVFVGTIDPAGAAALLDRLAGQAPEATASTQVGTWLERDLFPALTQALKDVEHLPDERRDTMDEVLLRALAGRDDPAQPVFEWEGERYRLAPAVAEYVRLQAVRERQAGPSLTDAYRLLAAAASLAQDATPATAAQAGTLIARIVLPDDETTAASIDREPSRRSAAAVARALASPIRNARDARRLATDLTRIAEDLLARVLRSYVYACHLGDADSRAFLAGDLAARHDLGLSSPDAGNRRRDPWLVPEEDVAHGRPWHVRGSLLGLELPLGRFALRRLLGAMPEDQPVVTTNDRQALVATLVFLHPRMLGEADRRAVLEGVRRGRNRVTALAVDDDGLEALQHRAGVSGWRAHVLLWAADHEPDALLSTLTRAELFWIGTDDGSEPAGAWGPSTWTADRAWRLAFPPRGSRELYAGRPAASLSMSTLADVTLHLAEIVDALGLPAGVVACIMPAALQDYVDEVRPAYQDDWLAFARQVTRLSPARVEDYTAGLAIAGGPLQPVPSEGSRSR